MIRTTLTMLALGAILIACNSSTDHAGHDHAGHDHVDHGGHAKAEVVPEEGTTAGEQPTAGAEMPEMEGMAKVDPEGAVKSWDAKPEAGAKGICPVSGEAFMVTDATVFSVFEGKFYGYCCAGCQGRFEADPQSFLSKAAEG